MKLQSNTNILLYLFFMTSVSLTSKSQTISDYDGNEYQTVIIGNQTWMAENLKTSHFNNGQIIPKITNDNEWINLSTPGYCFYNNDSASYFNNYGALYNWFAIQAENICPINWHVASDEEWKQLEIFLGLSREDADLATWRGQGIGGKLKYTGTTFWDSPNSGANNETNFKALSSGNRDWNDGSFKSFGQFTNFWTSTSDGEWGAFHRMLAFDRTDIFRASHDKKSGYSIRCICDSLTTISINNILLENFQMYPIPCKEIFFIDSELKIEHTKIYSLEGREIKSIRLNNKSSAIQINDLKKGVYIVKLLINNNCYIKKIMIE